MTEVVTWQNDIIVQINSQASSRAGNNARMQLICKIYTLLHSTFNIDCKGGDDVLCPEAPLLLAPGAECDDMQGAVRGPRVSLLQQVGLFFILVCFIMYPGKYNSERKKKYG